MTLDQLAHAMKGMPHDAPILVRTLEGLRPTKLVVPTRLPADGSTGPLTEQALP